MTPAGLRVGAPARPYVERQYARCDEAREGAFEGLRHAAKAADRGKAAQREWPGFEKRLTELGYSPLAIAHAFSTLTAGTVEEALSELDEHARSERVVPVPLAFEVVEREPALPVGHALHHHRRRA